MVFSRLPIAAPLILFIVNYGVLLITANIFDRPFHSHSFSPRPGCSFPGACLAPNLSTAALTTRNACLMAFRVFIDTHSGVCM
jgi:hypothetical protein